MAKSIQNKITGEIKRVSAPEAEEMCRGSWKYLGKMEARRILRQRDAASQANTGTHG